MRMLTKLLLLAGAGGALYALTKRDDLSEGGDTLEPQQCPPGQEWNEAAGMCVPAPPEGAGPPSAQFDPHPGLKPAKQPFAPQLKE
jgi:hypothetical protein